MQFPTVQSVSSLLTSVFAPARRIIPLLAPSQREVFIVLENPHEWETRDGQFDERFKSLFASVSEAFLKGYDIVVVNIGKPIPLEDAVETTLSGRGSWAGTASTIGSDYETGLISKETDRVIHTYQGIKKASSNVVRCFHRGGPYDEDSQSVLPAVPISPEALNVLMSSPKPSKCLDPDDSLYVVLVDLRKVQREEHPGSYATLVIEDNSGTN